MKTAIILLLGSIGLFGCAVDKQKHFAAGAIISSLVYAQTDDSKTACLSALAAGIAKEIYDAREGQADHADAVATVFGCGVTLAWD